ncbi:hypothetical protein PMAYCL1PPCAC_18009, partial [Pristionchus mayeri]
STVIQIGCIRGRRFPGSAEGIDLLRERSSHSEGMDSLSSSRSSHSELQCRSDGGEDCQGQFHRRHSKDCSDSRRRIEGECHY